MKRIKLLVCALALTSVLSVPALAGNIETSIAGNIETSFATVLIDLLSLF